MCVFAAVRTHQNGIGVLARLEGVIGQGLAGGVDSGAAKVVRLEVDGERVALLGNKFEHTRRLLHHLGADTVTGENDNVVGLLAHLEKA